MRSQTTSGSRKRGRESTPVRTTRLKTGGRHLLGLKGGEDNDVVDFFGDGKTSPVIGPDGPTDQQQQQPPPSKNRKQQQQQQQVANGFPVTVFPPADNNNSPPPPGPFQSRHNNKNSSSSRVVAAAKATVRLDNNKPEPSAAVAAVSRKVEAPPLGRRVDSDDASVRRQQMKEAFQPWVMQVRLRPQFLFFSFLLSFSFHEREDIQFVLLSSRRMATRPRPRPSHVASRSGSPAS